MRRSLCGTFSGRVTVREQDARTTKQTSRSSRAIMDGASGVSRMANPEHLAILRQGVEVWNQWRESNGSLVPPDLSGADLRGINLQGVNLKYANLSNTDLSNANLSGGSKLIRVRLTKANLVKTNFSGADFGEFSDFTEANLTEADLSESNLHCAIFENTLIERANLKKADLTRANCIKSNLQNSNLEEVTMEGAILEKANLEMCLLTQANLKGANFRGANLFYTSLVEAEAHSTDFRGAILTKACIKNWYITTQTKLDGVLCDYVYLEVIGFLVHQSKHKSKTISEIKLNFEDRRPRDPNKNFAPGEFAKLFQISFETIDLFFQDGVDWQAFTASFLNVRAENEDAEMEIQTIENTGDGILVKVRTTEKADKGAIEGNFWQGYEFARKQLQESYDARLSDKDSEINRLFLLVQQQSQQIVELGKQPKYDQRNSNFPGGVADTNYGKMVETQNNSQGDIYNQSGNIGIGHNEGTIADDAKAGGIIDEERRSSEG